MGLRQYFSQLIKADGIQGTSLALNQSSPLVLEHRFPIILKPSTFRYFDIPTSSVYSLTPGHTFIQFHLLAQASLLLLPYYLGRSHAPALLSDSHNITPLAWNVGCEYGRMDGSTLYVCPRLPHSSQSVSHLCVFLGIF